MLLPKITVEKSEVHSYSKMLVASYLNCDASTISIDHPLQDYGLDSVYAISLCSDLEAWLNVPVEPTLIWDYPTIKSFTDFLFEEYG